MPTGSTESDMVPWPHFQIQTIDNDGNTLLDEKQLAQAPFLKHATDEQANDFKKLIIQNRYTLKNDIEPMIDRWAAQQGGVVQADYNDFKKDTQTAGNLFVTAVNSAAISDEAKEGLRKLYAIERNKGISLADEKQQSAATIQRLSFEAKNELTRFLRDNRDIRFPCIQALSAIQTQSEIPSQLQIPEIYDPNKEIAISVQSVRDPNKQSSETLIDSSNDGVTMPDPSTNLDNGDNVDVSGLRSIQTAQKQLTTTQVTTDSPVQYSAGQILSPMPNYENNLSEQPIFFRCFTCKLQLNKPNMFSDSSS
uniref:DUF148 domain-containing protein n=1 Tax=Syphacia muris TaxID=451379 RepID=A0A0N5AFA1_9BILA